MIVRASQQRASAAAAQAPRPRATLVASPAGFATRGYVLGPRTSGRAIVVFSDFQCPYCRQFAATVDSLHRARPDIRIVERHFPLVGLHPEAVSAALGAECARDKGYYEPYRHQAFGHEALLEGEEWGRLAQLAGLRDTVHFVTCIRDSLYHASVDEDIAAGRRAGVHATPSILIGDTLYSGALTLEELSAKLAPSGR